MTKSQIKAELRRSACDDVFPFIGTTDYVFDLLCNTYMSVKEFNSDRWNREIVGVFFLLVAEAL